MRLTENLFSWMTGALAVLVIVQAMLNHQLSGRLREFQSQAAQSQKSHRLEPGAQVPPIVAKDLMGDPVRIAVAADPQPTLLYVFTPQCHWCSRNLENLKALAARAREGHRVVGLSLTSHGVAGYTRQHGVDFPVYTEPSKETVEAYRLGATPATILISSEGRVVRHWIGAFTGSTQKEIEQQFGVRLPGLTELPAAGQACSDSESGCEKTGVGGRGPGVGGWGADLTVSELAAARVKGNRRIEVSRGVSK